MIHIAGLVEDHAGLGPDLSLIVIVIIVVLAVEIQAADSAIKILIIPTNEQLEIASQTREILQELTHVS